jgi:hypothetical protein
VPGRLRAAAFNAGGVPYVQPATFLKLRQVSVSYALPGQLYKGLLGGRISSARLALTGRNLWSSFKYDGLDPEVSASGAQNIAHNVEITPFPPARSYFLSLDVSL